MAAQEQLNPINVTSCASAIRAAGKSSASMEDFAQTVTEQLYENILTRPSLDRACTLVRFFQIIEFQNLEKRLQKQALQAYPKVQPTHKFLTLLATRGSESSWNSRQDSEGHQIIPLLSKEMISESPMIARLLSQLGIEISNLLQAGSSQLAFADPKDRDYNIFYVHDARNSPFIPAQKNFVQPFGIRSVAGYGSVLADGSYYVVVTFFRVALKENPLKQFTALALSTTIGALSIQGDRIFHEHAKSDNDRGKTGTHTNDAGVDNTIDTTAAKKTGLSEDQRNASGSDTKYETRHA